MFTVESIFMLGKLPDSSTVLPVLIGARAIIDVQSINSTSYRTRRMITSQIVHNKCIQRRVARSFRFVWFFMCRVV